MIGVQLESLDGIGNKRVRLGQRIELPQVVSRDRASVKLAQPVLNPFICFFLYHALFSVQDISSNSAVRFEYVIAPGPAS